MRKLLSKYSEFNFFMSQKFLKAVIEAEELEFNGVYILLKNEEYFIPQPNKKIRCFVDYEGYVGLGNSEFWNVEYGRFEKI